MSGGLARRSIPYVTPRRRLTAPQWAFDVCVALFVVILGFVGTIQIGDRPDVDFIRDADVFHFTLVSLMALPLVFRRVYTVPVFVTVLVAWIIDRGLDYPDTPAAMGVAIAFYTIGAELDRRPATLIGGVSSAAVVAWTGIGAAALESVTIVALLTTTIATVTPLLLGREMHERRRRIEELRLKIEEADRAREEQARRAVLEERSRIARELHDVVAHQVTVMTLQAEGARRIATGADPRISEALETIRVTGHSALMDMRRTLGLLRQEDQGPDTKPLPRLSDIEDLVDQMTKAGVDVDVEVNGERQPLSDGAELSAYRVVQESLTNAIRHGGPGVSAKVLIDYTPDHLAVSVTDDGRGSSSTNADNGGHGIIGMRERVAVLGGHFEAGPKVGGGYRVHATIPVDA